MYFQAQKKIIRFSQNIQTSWDLGTFKSTYEDYRKAHQVDREEKKDEYQIYRSKRKSLWAESASSQWHMPLFWMVVFAG